MASRTAEYYRKNPAARKRRLKQQSKYQKTTKGKSIKKNANKLRNKLKLKIGDKRDAAHYKGSKTKGRPQHRSKNRARLSIRRRK
tara:strand:- start:493 stop:747 length:255 start_codon:yes stop_codon:yes gene_type:complete